MTQRKSKCLHPTSKMKMRRWNSTMECVLIPLYKLEDIGMLVLPRLR
jgi:hypothetical protein